MTTPRLNNNTPRWQVRATDRRTLEQVTIAIEASSIADAQHRADSLGFAVIRVDAEPPKLPDTPSVIDEGNERPENHGAPAQSRPTSLVSWLVLEALSPFRALSVLLSILQVIGLAGRLHTVDHPSPPPLDALIAASDVRAVAGAVARIIGSSLFALIAIVLAIVFITASRGARGKIALAIGLIAMVLYVGVG